MTPGELAKELRRLNERHGHCDGCNGRFCDRTEMLVKLGLVLPELIEAAANITHEIHCEKAVDAITWAKRGYNPDLRICTCRKEYVDAALMALCVAGREDGL
jgi:hypothetical protein